MTVPASPDAFRIFVPPYHTLDPLPGASSAWPERPGAALLWQMAVSRRPPDHRAAAERPAGVALIVILPPARVLPDGQILGLIDRCRPHSILPYHPEPRHDDLAIVLRRPPEALPVAVVDYLSWRGVRVDAETRHLIRRTLDMSETLRTVTGLARSLYLSRRALGRRFLSRGLPAPSHWLQVGRLLRASLRLQSTDESLFGIATDLGYPDGFALSNQMKRMLGVRPSVVRESFGWEWIVETWLRMEHAEGSLRFDLGATEAPIFTKVAEAHALSTAGNGGSDGKGDG